jgi:hypothetical protein
MEREEKAKRRRRQVIVFLVGFYLITNSWLLYQTHQSASGHTQEINQTAAVVQQIKGLQISHQNDLKTIKADTDLVAGYAATLNSTISGNHGESIDDLQLICLKLGITGCTGETSSP